MNPNFAIVPFSSAAKAAVQFAVLTARLKPRPFKAFTGAKAR
jgi:hypothetical protein